jgi:outer membrane immunogenic protein
MFRTALAAAVLFLAGASPALADPTGLRATALAGVERTDAAPGSGASDGLYLGGQLGYDWRLGPVIVGVEGDLGGSSASQLVGSREADQGVFASAAVRLAVPVTSSLRGFVRGGYAYHEVTYDTGRAFHGSGWTLGGGGELDVTQRVFVRVEYRYSDYGRTVRGQQFLGGVGLRF